MKDLILTILFLLFLAPFAFAQSPQPVTDSLTDEQWMPIYQALEIEDFDTAEKLASKYLDEVKTRRRATIRSGDSGSCISTPPPAGSARVR